MVSVSRLAEQFEKFEREERGIKEQKREKEAKRAEKRRIAEEKKEAAAETHRKMLVEAKFVKPKMRGKAKFLIKSVLGWKDYIVFLLIGLSSLVIVYMGSILLRDAVVQTFFQSPTIKQLNLRTFYDVLVQLMVISQFSMIIAFFVLTHVLVCVASRAMNIQVIRAYLVSVTAFLIAFVAYYGTLYWQTVNNAIFTDLDNLDDIVQGFIENATAGRFGDINFFVFAVYYLDVFAEEPTLMNYVTLIAITKVFAPHASFFYSYDFLFVYLIYVPIQVTLMWRIVKPCNMFEPVEAGRQVIGVTVGKSVK